MIASRKELDASVQEREMVFYILPVYHPFGEMYGKMCIGDT